MSKNPFGLKKIYFLVLRHKFHFLSWVLLVVLAVFLFNIFSHPVYQSQVVLKKEQSADYRSTDDLGKIIAMQTLDEVETEIEIVKSRTVLEKVTQELLLSITVQQFTSPSGEFFKSDGTYPLYQAQLNRDKTIRPRYPEFLELRVNPADVGNDYRVLVVGKNQLSLIIDRLITGQQSIDPSREFVLSLPAGTLVMRWPDPEIGSEIRFSIRSFEKILEKLHHAITIKRLGKTNLFQISVKAGSSLESQLIARTVVEKFREVRLEQKQQTIRYSFNFVDQQLQDTEIRLKQAEDTLSKFKSAHQITSIDKNSEEIINFLSRLEGEKIDVELKLSEYENRLIQMKREHRNKEYFDQTYLTPVPSNESYSPFSALLRELSDLELRQLELLQRRKESHPDVVTLNDQIKQVKQKLSSYNQNTITAYEIIMKALTEKRKNLNQLIENYSTRIARLPATETRLAELIRARDALGKKFTLLLDKREEMRMAELSKLQDIVVIDTAQQPLKPVFPRKTLNLALALLGGIILGVMSILLKEYFSEKVSDVEEIESDFQIPLLTVLPFYDKKIKRSIQSASTIKDRFVTLMEDQHGFRESYKILRVKLNDHLNKKNKMVMITSGEENTGKTTVSANLAITMAQAGKNVLLMDADLRKGKIGKFFNIPAEKSGLSEYLRGETGLADLYHSGFVENHLQILTCGKRGPEAAELLEDGVLKSLIHGLQGSFDAIIIDTPPVTRVVDPILIGKHVKNVILVVRPDLTFRESIRGAVQDFQRAKMELLGIVANASDVAHSPYRYRYGYGYGYPHKK